MKVASKKGRGRKPLTDEERLLSRLRRKARQALNNARYRTTNPKSRDWPRYGGRGIAMASEWAASPDVFIKDMGLPPTLSHSLDRRDNDGPYSKVNCRWITTTEQNRNQRKNIWVDVGFGPMVASEADRRLGVREGTIATYIQKTINKAVKPFRGPETT